MAGLRSFVGEGTITWKYDGYRGWVTNKTYQTTNGPSYAYTLGGRLKTRTWARGVTTTYSTNAAGEIVGIDYSDTTPDVSFGRDRQGRVIAVTNGSSITSISYNEAGQMLSETRDGLTVTNAYDSLLRLAAVGYDGANASPAQYGYDAASRLSALTHSLNTATYNYVENSSLIGDIQFRTNGNLRMSANRQYDNLNRLTSVSSVPSASSAVSFSYLYNLANQRTNVTIGPDNSSWRYGYDDLGQVTSGKKYWPDSTPVAGQQFEYEFDDIGNRLRTKGGGDASGGGMRLANYTNNLLNQITGRGVPGTNDVIGIAHASANVTVNGQAAYRKGEYYHL